MSYVSVTAARALPGLRMVGIARIPSPWTEAAKGIFRIKRLPVVMACPQPEDPPNAVADWAGDPSIPVVAYEQEKLRTGWAQILLLAERLAPTPALLPAAAGERALMFGLAHEICGEMGLGWCMRLLLIRDSLGHGGADGAPPQVGSYLAPRYGFDPDSVLQAEQRVIDILTLLDTRLQSRTWLMGEQLTALDVYWATFANLIAPLPESAMPMATSMRRAYTCTNAAILAALSPALRAHQDKVYNTCLELPVQL